MIPGASKTIIGCVRRHENDSCGANIPPATPGSRGSCFWVPQCVRCRDREWETTKGREIEQAGVDRGNKRSWGNLPVARRGISSE